MSSTSRPRGRQVSAAQAVGLLVSFVLIATVGGVITAGLALPAVGAINTTTNLTVTAFNDLPSELTPQTLPEKSNILAADGTQLATFYAQNRVIVPLNDISVQLQHAVVATEDMRFYEHSGVDLRGMGRALVLSVLKPNSQQQGASTITQQYVKNTLIEEALNADTKAEQLAGVKAATVSDGSAGYARKLREAKLAISLEQRESKDQILEGYLNIAPFGTSVYGAETAANHYFSKPAKDLTYLEAATIAGITQNPSKWDPVVNPKGSQGRRDVVLKLMYDQGYITKADYTKGVATPIAKTLHVSAVKQGCMTASDAVPGSGYFCDYVTKVILNDPAFGPSKADRQALLYKGGLTITTTLDPGEQKIADTEVKASIPVADPSGVLQAMSVVEPGTGQIKAMAQNTIYDVTGSTEPGHDAVNYNTDRAYGGSQGFQPGSTFKAFTLLTWLEAGHSLYETVNASVSSYKINSFTSSCSQLASNTWHVGNSEGTQSGVMTVLDATRNSVNRAFAAMAHQLDLCTIMQNAADLGVVQDGTGNNFNAVPANVLGTDSTTPLAMAGAYATFAASGMFCKPIAILRVQDSSGADLAVPSAGCEQKVAPDIANAVAFAMSKVWTGTARTVTPKPSFPAAGKTGTSNNNENTWFAGYTPRLAAAVVVGRSTPSTVKGVVGGHWFRYVFGSDIAAPTWARFMTQALASGDNPGFGTPPDTLLYGAKLSVPYVVGSSVNQATSTLTAAGFTVSVAGTPITSDVTAGLVAAQSTTKATKGAVITLTLSAGPATGQPAGPGQAPGSGNNPGPPGQGG